MTNLPQAETTRAHVQAFFETELAKFSPEIADPLRYALMAGGKFFRAHLCLTCATLFGDYNQAFIRTAAALEAIHTYSLIHDDLPAMDDDDMRRGKPSMHRAYSQATAILVGDALQAQAFAWLAEPETDPDPAIRAELIRLLADAIGANGMVLGQFLDIKNSANDSDALAQMHRLKTGRLIIASAEMGATIARADDNTKKILAQFADKIGRAYQMVDDSLDVESDPAKLGKTIGKDARHGKTTFASLLGIDETRARAQALIAEAQALINTLNADTQSLHDIAQFVIQRDC